MPLKIRERMFSPMTQENTKIDAMRPPARAAAVTSKIPSQVFFCCPCASLLDPLQNVAKTAE